MITNAIKNTVKRALRLAPQLTGWSLHGYRIADVPNEVRVRLLAELGVDLVLDVGGHVGSYGSGLRLGGYSGQISSFEPVGSAFERLSDKASRDQHWSVYRTALGSHAENATMNVTNFTYSIRSYPLAAPISRLPQQLLRQEWRRLPSPDSMNWMSVEQLSAFG